MAADQSTDPASAGGDLAHPAARPAVLLRRLIGVLGLIEAVLVLALIPVVFYAARVFGAAGDGFQRAVIAAGLLVVVGFLIAVVGFSDWSAGTILRSPASWAFAVILMAVVLWASFSIDSTRPIRSLPEADLAYPGSTELGRSASPAQGGMDAVASARFTRSFVTTDPYPSVHAFYGSRLIDAGWSGPFEYGSGRGRLVNWRRDGFQFQLEIPSESPTGPFTVTIYGPPQ